MHGLPNLKTNLTSILAFLQASALHYAGNKEAGLIHAPSSAGDVVVRVPPVVPRNDLMFLCHTDVMTKHYALRN